MSEPTQPETTKEDAGGEDVSAELPPPKESAWSFVASVVVMLAVLVGIEFGYRDTKVHEMTKKSYHHVMKLEVYRKIGGDVVVTGSSRIFHGFIPQTMTDVLVETTGKRYSSYNLGVPAGRIPLFQMMAHEAARNAHRPKLFVIGVDPVLWSCCETISASHMAPMLHWSMIPWLVRSTWWALPEEAGSAILMGLSSTLAERADVVYAYQNVVLPGPPLNFENSPGYGWISQGGRVGEAVQAQRAAGRTTAYGKLMDKSLKMKVLDVNRHFLENAIRELQGKGIKVLVIGTPQARQLDANHDHAHTYFEAMDAVHDVCAKTNVPFADFNDFPGLENVDFVDGDHLSEPGAQKFTQALTRTAITPLLQ